MKEEKPGFPARDAELGELLAEAASGRSRSEAEWASLEARVSAAGALPLARRRRAWPATVMARARPLAAAAVVVLVVLGGVVWMTPRPMAAYADVSAELIELLGEEEVRSFFPGVDDPDRLLEAAIAAR
jgi:negative regulator of sigma E activity